MSESSGHKKLLEAKKVIAQTPIPKNRTAKVKSQRTGGEYSYKYADLADVLYHVSPALHDAGLVLVHPIRDGSVYACVKDESGNTVEESGLALPEFGGDAQAFGSLLTYFKRYLTYTVLGIHPDEDGDGRGANGDGKAKRRPFEATAAKGAEKAPEPDLSDPDQARETIRQAMAKRWDAEDAKAYFNSWLDDLGVKSGAETTVEQRRVFLDWIEGRRERPLPDSHYTQEQEQAA